MPVMLYLCFEGVKSIYMRTYAGSCIVKTQLSQEFCS